MIWLFVIPYALVYLGATRMLAGHFAWEFVQSDARYKKREYHQYRNSVIADAKPNFQWWLWATIVSAVLVLFWPVILLVRTPFIPKIGAEREAEKRQMKQRIHELEREAGL